ncbi:hypothetical protein [Allomesorhizobium camelthorni]|uniref:DUF995 domain-containing protein n=1 Tax=Allomesorhizobium camelthorni TaxID=475069 RepID=A0A6G4WCZ7_9HYPH|nr:hypothetical protein [Mesorhizobium camelthorni]NGO52208.1 hypothetical protein [Mesorhizobium camelthorni]
MKRASIATILLCSMVPAKAEGGLATKWAGPNLTTIVSGKSDIATLYADRQAVVVEYVMAMRRYEVLTGPWTWVGANGDSVRRIGNDVFRVSLGNYAGNWFTELECIALEWPMFLCSDGKERKMSAPDPSTMIFDGVEYKRLPPRK